jgi:hypothetical protein
MRAETDDDPAAVEPLGRDLRDAPMRRSPSAPGRADQRPRSPGRAFSDT